MLVEFRIINDPLRPSISTNLCSVCYRTKNDKTQRIGCCTYEPEFCLFDLVFIFLHYPDIYQLIMTQGQIIPGFNGIMLEIKSGLDRCPFASKIGCVLPKDALTPLCRLYICRQAAVFGPAEIEDKIEEYKSSVEYSLNNFLNLHLKYDKSLSKTRLHNFIVEFSQTVNSMLAKIDRNNPPIETFKIEMNIEDFGIVL